MKELLTTDLVLPSGNTIEAKPHEIVQIAREQPIVTSSAYDVDGQPAVSLDWSTGEHSRVEQFEDFTLYAWTTRLSSQSAISIFKAKAVRGAQLFAVTATAGVVSAEAAQFDRRYVESRADQVRLLRLENPDITFLWEIRDGRGGGGKHADFVVMSAQATPEDLGSLIEETGMPRVVLAEGEILDLARRAGAW